MISKNFIKKSVHFLISRPFTILNSVLFARNKTAILAKNIVVTNIKKMKELLEKIFLTNKLDKWLSNKSFLLNGGDGWPMLVINALKLLNLKNAVNKGWEKWVLTFKKLNKHSVIVSVAMETINIYKKALKLW